MPDTCTQYYNLGGSDGAVPIMSLGEDLQNMSLDGPRSIKQIDPVEDAIQKGRAPTIGDVKKSLRVCVALSLPPTDAHTPA